MEADRTCFFVPDSGPSRVCKLRPTYRIHPKSVQSCGRTARSTRRAGVTRPSVGLRQRLQSSCLSVGVSVVLTLLKHREGTSGEGPEAARQKEPVRRGSGEAGGKSGAPGASEGGPGASRGGQGPVSWGSRGSQRKSGGPEPEAGPGFAIAEGRREPSAGGFAAGVAMRGSCRGPGFGSVRWEAGSPPWARGRVGMWGRGDGV